MKRVVELKYYCPKCRKDLVGRVYVDMPGEMFNEEEKERIKKFFLSAHYNREHSFCARCKKKIRVGIDPKESWGIRLVGKSYEKPRFPGDTGLILWTAMFCKNCIAEIDKEKQRVAK
jgi:hypothetical protein